MNLTDEIRKTIESVKDMKIQMGGINNYLNAIENLVRKDATEQVDNANKQGLEDAWEYAKKIVLNPDDGGLGLSELNEIFGFYTIQSIFKNYTVQQAIEKLKAYEKEQKADDTINVGDIITDGKINYLVMDITDKSYIALQGTDFEPAYIGKDYIKSYHNLHDSKDMQKIAEEINKAVRRCNGVN